MSNERASPFTNGFAPSPDPDSSQGQLSPNTSARRDTPIPTSRPAFIPRSLPAAIPTSSNPFQFTPDSPPNPFQFTPGSPTHSFIDMDDARSTGVFRILINMAADRDSTDGITRREASWLRRQTRELGLPRFPPRNWDTRAPPESTPSDEPVPRPPVDDRSPPQPTIPTSVQTPATPPSISSGAPNVSIPGPAVPVVPPTTLRQLPRWFHEWLTNPVLSPHVRATIARCPYLPTRLHARRYQELSTRITDTSNELQRIKREYDETNNLLAALLWDRSASARTLLQYNAESTLADSVASYGDEPEGGQGGGGVGGDGGDGGDDDDDDAYDPDGDLANATSSPDGTHGVAFAGGMGAGNANDGRVGERRVEHQPEEHPQLSDTAVATTDHDSDADSDDDSAPDSDAAEDEWRCCQHDCDQHGPAVGWACCDHRCGAHPAPGAHVRPANPDDHRGSQRLDLLGSQGHFRNGICIDCHGNVNVNKVVGIKKPVHFPHAHLKVQTSRRTKRSAKEDLVRPHRIRPKCWHCRSPYHLKRECHVLLRRRSSLELQKLRRDWDRATGWETASLGPW